MVANPEDRFCHYVAQVIQHLNVDAQKCTTSTDSSLPRSIGISDFNKKNEPPHDKTKKMECAPCKDSDQPVDPPSLRCPHEGRLIP